ncbi:DNA-binding protein [Candidatus Micrarchaeota archaeon]|nr:DNA-binding protein [Candidatus Micrarchaeota archaeon]
MQFRKDANAWVVVLQRGEKIKETLDAWAKKEGVRGGAVTAIGALKDPTLAYYDLKKKQYLNRGFSGDFELVSLSGNFSETGLHAHAVIAGPDFQAFGGHLVEAEVSITCEAFVIPVGGIGRKLDEKSGLKHMRVD